MATIKQTISDLRYRWAMASMAVRLIVVNVAAFLITWVATLVGSLIGSVLPLTAVSWFECPASLWDLLLRPWSVISYSFVHADVLHLLFNMLWLYWFGMIFMLSGSERRLLAVYLYGALGGAVAFVAYAAVMPVGLGSRFLAGSSASVLALVTYTALMHPDYRVGLVLLGQVAVKWIAIVTVAFALLSCTSGATAAAHIGGIAVGALCFVALRYWGMDPARPIDAIAKILERRRPLRARPSHSATSATSRATATGEADLDAILEKIRRSGYAGLTADEKSRLFEISKKIK